MRRQSRGPVECQDPYMARGSDAARLDYPLSSYGAEQLQWTQGKPDVHVWLVCLTSRYA